MTAANGQAAWRTVGASVIGTSHERLGTGCQDAHRVLTLPQGDATLLVAAVSDGAGSASHSHLGSALACDLWLAEFRALIEAGGRIETLDRTFVEAWLDRLREAVGACAEAEGVAPRQLAATFLGAAVGDECALFAQVGDGAIVASWAEEPERHDPVFWPQSGEYANMTFFATEPDAAAHLQFVNAEMRVEELALFSDGLQSVALDLAARSSFQPFFTGMFRALRPAPPGTEASVAEGLQAFLASKKLAERTDDDKTLILATRLSPALREEGPTP